MNPFVSFHRKKTSEEEQLQAGNLAEWGWGRYGPQIRYWQLPAYCFEAVVLRKLPIATEAAISEKVFQNCRALFPMKIMPNGFFF